MATRNKTKGTVVALAEKLIAGTNKHLTNTTQVMLVGQSLSPAQIKEHLSAIVNLRNDVDTAKATAKAKLAVEKTDMPSRRAIMDAFVGYVKVSFGNQPDVLADFGVHPKARTPLSAEAKTAAAAKRKATRAARHTTGSKQKKGVKGAVTGIVVTPVTTPQPVVPAPASPSTPAVTSPGATAGTTPHTS